MFSLIFISFLFSFDLSNIFFKNFLAIMLFSNKFIRLQHGFSWFNNFLKLPKWIIFSHFRSVDIDVEFSVRPTFLLKLFMIVLWSKKCFRRFLFSFKCYFWSYFRLFSIFLSFFIFFSSFWFLRFFAWNRCYLNFFLRFDHSLSQSWHFNILIILLKLFIFDFIQSFMAL